MKILRLPRTGSITTRHCGRSSECAWFEYWWTKNYPILLCGLIWSFPLAESLRCEALELRRFVHIAVEYCTDADVACWLGLGLCGTDWDWVELSGTEWDWGELRGSALEWVEQCGTEKESLMDQHGFNDTDCCAQQAYQGLMRTEFFIKYWGPAAWIYLRITNRLKFRPRFGLNPYFIKWSINIRSINMR